MPGIENSVGLELASGSGLTNFYEHILREHFLQEVADALNHDYVLKERWQSRKTVEGVRGTNIRYPAKTGRNVPGFGAMGESGFLPDPDAAQYDTYRFTQRRVYHRILFSGMAEAFSEGEVDSWLEARASEFADARDNLDRQENRMLWNNGTGILATLTGADGTPDTVFGDGTGPGGTIQLNSTIDAATTSPGMPVTNFVEPRQRHAFIDAGTGLIDAVATVLSKTDTTITYTASVDLTGGVDYHLVVANRTDVDTGGGGVDSTGYQREPMGIEGIASAGNVPAYWETDTPDLSSSFQGIDATANDFNQAVVLDNGGVNRPLTERLLQSAFTAAWKKLQGRPSAILGSYEIRDTFADYMLVYRRQVNKMSLAAGFDTVSYNGVPFVPDRDAYPNRVYLPDEDDVAEFVTGSGDYSFIDEDGAIVQRTLDQHKFQATLYRFYNWGSFVRGRQTKILDLEEIGA